MKWRARYATTHASIVHLFVTGDVRIALAPDYRGVAVLRIKRLGLLNGLKKIAGTDGAWQYRHRVVQSGLMIFLDFVVLFFFGFGGCISKVSNGFPHATADFRQFSRPKDDQNNNEYDDEFGHSYSKHVRLLLC